MPLTIAQTTITKAKKTGLSRRSLEQGLVGLFLRIICFALGLLLSEIVTTNGSRPSASATWLGFSALTPSKTKSFFTAPGIFSVASEDGTVLLASGVLVATTAAFYAWASKSCTGTNANALPPSKSFVVNEQTVNDDDEEEEYHQLISTESISVVKEGKDNDFEAEEAPPKVGDAGRKQSEANEVSSHMSFASTESICSEELSLDSNTSSEEEEYVVRKGILSDDHITKGCQELATMKIHDTPGCLETKHHTFLMKWIVEQEAEMRNLTSAIPMSPGPPFVPVPLFFYAKREEAAESAKSKGKEGICRVAIETFVKNKKNSKEQAIHFNEKIVATQKLEAAKKERQALLAAQQKAGDSEAERLEQARLAKLRVEKEALQAEQARLTIIMVQEEVQRREEARLAKKREKEEFRRREETQLAKKRVEEETRQKEEERLTAFRVEAQRRLDEELIREKTAADILQKARTATNRLDEKKMESDLTKTIRDEVERIEEEKLLAKIHVPVASKDAAEGLSEEEVWLEIEQMARAKEARDTKKAALLTRMLSSELTALTIPSDADIQAVYDDVKKNADGSLSLKEVKKVMKKQKELFVAKSESLVLALNRMDTDRDKNISQTEFFQFIRCAFLFRSLLSLFMSLDADNLQRLSKQEFLAATKILRFNEPETLFNVLEEKGENSVKIEKFCIWIAEKIAAYPTKLKSH